MPETDYAITDRIEEVKKHRERLRKSYDTFRSFVNDRTSFLRDKGDVFFSLLGDLRKEAVQSSKRAPSQTPVVSGEEQETDETEPKHKMLSSTLAGAVVAAVSIIALTTLGIYGYLKPGSVVLGIFGVLGFVFIPGLVMVWLLSRQGKEEQKQNLDTLFDEMIEDYKKALFIGRVILGQNPSVLKKGPDYYKILGIPKDADNELVKTSFRKLVIQYHPDHSKSKNAEEKFMQVIEAHEILSDPIKKSQYDASNEIRDTPYNDELATDAVAQAQLFLSAKFNRLLGTIYSVSERELDRRERIALEQAAMVSGASAVQPMRSSAR